MKATLYKVDGSKEPLTLTKKNRLETLQKLVGGYIEVININGKDLILNEEGLLLDLPLNPWSQYLTFKTVWEGQWFSGDIVLIDGVLP